MAGEAIKEAVMVVMRGTKIGDSLSPVDVAREVGGAFNEVCEALEVLHTEGLLWTGPTGRYSLSRKGNGDGPEAENGKRGEFPCRHKGCDKVLSSEKWRDNHEARCPHNPDRFAVNRIVAGKRPDIPVKLPEEPAPSVSECDDRNAIAEAVGRMLSYLNDGGRGEITEVVAYVDGVEIRMSRPAVRVRE